MYRDMYPIDKKGNKVDQWSLFRSNARWQPETFPTKKKKTREPHLRNGMDLSFSFEEGLSYPSMSSDIELVRREIVDVMMMVRRGYSKDRWIDFLFVRKKKKLFNSTRGRVEDEGEKAFLTVDLPVRGVYLTEKEAGVGRGGGVGGGDKRACHSDTLSKNIVVFVPEKPGIGPTEFFLGFSFLVSAIQISLYLKMLKYGRSSDPQQTTRGTKQDRYGHMIMKLPRYCQVNTRIHTERKVPLVVRDLSNFDQTIRYLDSSGELLIPLMIPYHG